MVDQCLHKSIYIATWTCRSTIDSLWLTCSVNSEEPWSVSKWSFFLNHSLWILVRGISQVESGSWVTQQSLWVIVTVPSLCHLETHVGEQSNVFILKATPPFKAKKTCPLLEGMCQDWLPEFCEEYPGKFFFQLCEAYKNATWRWHPQQC